MKKNIFVLCAFLLILLSTSVFAQSTNWADYGLTEEDVQHLSGSEKQAILKSNTPAQTEENRKTAIESNDIDSITPIPGLTKLHGVNSPVNPEITSCFDKYTFGSIEADMTSQSSNAVSGTTMDFFGDIKNNNAYPIVEGTLYVKIFKKGTEEKNPNGPDVVDQFIAVDNITIPANGSVPAAFTWKVPAFAQTGDYQLVTYFTSDKKFNLLGLSFTDDIVGNSFNFTVDGEKTGVSFDKSSAVINDSPYFFAAFPPHILPTDDASVTIAVDNTTDKAYSSNIKWKLYKWDSMNQQNLVREFTTFVQIKADSSQTVELNIPEKNDPVYYLVGEIVYEDSKSIVGIRFVRDGVDKVRLNFPSLLAYPLHDGESATMFTCLHNSGSSASVSNNKVVLEIKDTKGRVVESYTYEGEVTGEMMAIKKDFISKVNLDTFTLHASLYTNDVLVDESTMEYDCKLINPEGCRKTGLKEIISLAGGLIILLSILLVVKKYKTKNNLILPLFFSALLCGLFAVPNVTEAKSTSWNKIVSQKFAYFWNNDELSGSGSGWQLGLTNPNITIKYDVDIKNLDTGAMLSDGSSVPVGTRLRLKFYQHNYSDISWFGTGYSADSPYGRWKEGAAAPAEDKCRADDFVNYYNYTLNGAWALQFNVYVPLMVDFPKKTITNKENLSCDALIGNEADGYTMDCTVSAAGPIKPAFNFGATYGKFYYQYKFLTDYRGTKGMCISNSIPMKTGTGMDQYQGFSSNEVTPYTLDVPAKTINYSLTAFTPPPVNNPPAAPTISGPVNGNVSISYSFGIRATDPDGDNVIYGLDWNNDEVIDQWLPSSSMVNSGTVQNTSKAWSTLGGNTFRARTYDQHWVASAWTSHSISLTAAPIYPICSLTIDQCDPGTPKPEVDSLTHENWSCSSGDETVSCTQIKKDPNEAETLRCFATPNPALRNEEVTYKASNTTGKFYRWFTDSAKTNQILNEISSVYKRSYSNINSYTVTVDMEKIDGSFETAICPVVTVGCGVKPVDGICRPGDVTRTVYKTCQPNGMYATEEEPCSVSPDTPDATFYFNPNIVGLNDTCKVFLEAKNVSSCTLKNKSGISKLNAYALFGETTLLIAGEKRVDVGVYTLTCTTSDGLSSKTFPETKSCISNPNFREI